jgi:serine/threonine protein kinase
MVPAPTDGKGEFAAQISLVPKSATAEPTTTQPTLESVRLNGYRITERLGIGGMGTVWRAVQVATNREVALKLLNASETVSDRAKRRFEREVEVASRLEHPNIARVYDSGVHDGAYYYAMELIEGQPIDEYIQRKQLGGKGVLRLMGAVSRAIQYAHQKGVIHRDVKPSNVLVDESGIPHVVDFGLGKLLCEESPLATISLQGEWAGTPAYMSPEQAWGNSDQVDTRTDIYSLGVILYQLATGRLPHDSTGGHLAVLQRVVREEIIRPRRIASNIDRELEAIILKATAKRANDRYSSAQALAEDIDNYLLGEPITARRATSVYFLRKKLAKHRFTLGLVAAGIITLITVIAADSIRVTRERNAALEANARSRVLLHESTLRLADSFLSLADLLQENGNWRDAQSRYWDAYQKQSAEGGDTTEFGLGLLESLRSAPPEISSCHNDGNPSSVPVALFPDANDRTVWVQQVSGIIQSSDMITGRPITSIGKPINDGQVVAAVGHADSHAIYRTIQYFRAGHRQMALQRMDVESGGIEERNLTQELESFPQTIAVNGQQAVAAFVGQAGGTNRQNELWVISFNGGVPQWVEQGPPRMQLRALSLAPDCHSIALLDRSGQLCVFDLDSSAPTSNPPSAGDILDHAVPYTISCLKWAPNGSGILVGCATGQVGLVSITPAPHFTSYGASDGRVHLLAFSHTCRFALSADDTGMICLWEMSTGERRRMFVAGGGIVSMELSPDDRVLVAATSDGKIHIWSTDLDRQPILCQPALPVRCIATSNDDSLVAVASVGKVDVVDTKTHAILQSALIRGDATSLAFSTDGRALIVGTDRGEIASLRLGRAEEAKVIDDFVVDDSTSHAGRADSNEAPAASNAVYLSASADAAIDLTPTRAILIKLTPVRSICRLDGNFSLVGCISADGSEAVSLSDRNGPGWRINVFDLNEGTARSTQIQQVAKPTAIAISDDRNIAYIASADNSLEAVDLRLGRRLWRKLGYQSAVVCISVSSTGQGILSGGRDGTLRLWGIHSGRPSRLVATGLNPVTAIAMSPKGDLILCNGGPDNGVCLWDSSEAVYLHDSQIRAEQARQDLVVHPLDCDAVGALVEWYTAWGLPDWGQELLNRARSDTRP